MKQTEFISRSTIKHSNIYDYSLVEYIRNSIKVKIICNTHGIFEQRPTNHLDGQGCPKCAKESSFLTNENFISNANRIHNLTYNYEKVRYIRNDKKVIIICPTHGEFLQSPNHHINMKQGCPKCKYAKIKLNLENFIKKSIIKHGNRYDYSKINEFSFNKKVTIICPIHGEFLQLPNNHSNLGYGCYMCKNSIGEKAISNILDSMNIKYIREKTFEQCRNKNKLPFDFYLPEYNICIEYQGIQHFKPIDYFGGEKRFKEQIKNDNIKLKWCKENGINFIKISYCDNIIEKILNFQTKINKS